MLMTSLPLPSLNSQARALFCVALGLSAACASSPEAKPDTQSTDASAAPSSETETPAPTEPAPAAAAVKVFARGYGFMLPEGFMVVDAPRIDQAKVLKSALRGRTSLGRDGTDEQAIIVDVDPRKPNEDAMDDATCAGLTSMQERFKADGREVALTVHGFANIGTLRACHMQMDEGGKREDSLFADINQRRVLVRCVHGGLEPALLEQCRAVLGGLSVGSADRSFGTGYSIAVPAGFYPPRGSFREKIHGVSAAVLHSAMVVATERRGAGKVLGSIVVVPAAEDGNNPADQAHCQSLAEQMTASAPQTLQSAQTWARDDREGCRIDMLKDNVLVRWHVVRAIGLQMVLTCTLAVEDIGGKEGCDLAATSVEPAEHRMWWRPTLGG